MPAAPVLWHTQFPKRELARRPWWADDNEAEARRSGWDRSRVDAEIGACVDLRRRIEFVTIRYAGRMADQRFSDLSDEDRADIWYALAGAEIRHTDCFKHLVDATIYELELRKGAGVRPFLDLRFEHLRLRTSSRMRRQTRKAQRRAPLLWKTKLASGYLV
jgi:hypothetical protein